MNKALIFSRRLMGLISSVQPADSDWHLKKLDELALFEKQKRIHNAQIEHDLELLKIQFSEEIKRTREREARITQDYKEFLDHIDEMKLQIVEAFPDMPKALALLIHQHAKRLIDELWNNSDEQTQQLYRAKLAEFFRVVLDDTTQSIVDENKPRIPERTLALIQ